MSCGSKQVSAGVWCMLWKHRMGTCSPALGILRRTPEGGGQGLGRWRQWVWKLWKRKSQPSIGGSKHRGQGCGMWETCRVRNGWSGKCNVRQRRGDRAWLWPWPWKCRDTRVRGLYPKYPENHTFQQGLNKSTLQKHHSGCSVEKGIRQQCNTGGSCEWPPGGQ